MSVKRDVEGVMVVLGDVEGASTEILGSLHRFSRQVLKSDPRVFVRNEVERFHEASGAGAVEGDVESVHSFEEGVLGGNARSGLAWKLGKKSET